MADPIQDYILKHVFDAGGSTGKTYYYRITDRYQTRIVRDADKVLVPTGDLTWAEGSIPMEEEKDSASAGMGVYRILFYATMKGGVYNVTVYEQLGGSPDPTDDVVEQKQHKHGGIFGF